jgi:hypothetical protein
VLTGEEKRRFLSEQRASDTLKLARGGCEWGRVMLHWVGPDDDEEGERV